MQIRSANRAECELCIANATNKTAELKKKSNTVRTLANATKKTAELKKKTNTVRTLLGKDKQVEEEGPEPAKQAVEKGVQSISKKKELRLAAFGDALRTNSATATQYKCLKETTYLKGQEIQIQDPSKWHVGCDEQIELGTWSNSLRRWQGDREACKLKQRIRNRTEHALNTFKRASAAIPDECREMLDFEIEVDERDYGSFVQPGAKEIGVLNKEKASGTCMCPQTAPIITAQECEALATAMGETWVGYDDPKVVASASKYSVGQYQSNSCPSGSTKITDNTQCKAAAAANGKEYMGNDWWAKNCKDCKLPGGCGHHKNQDKYYFNHPNGNSGDKSGSSPVCKVGPKEQLAQDMKTIKAASPKGCYRYHGEQHRLAGTSDDAEEKQKHYIRGVYFNDEGTGAEPSTPKSKDFWLQTRLLCKRWKEMAQSSCTTSATVSGTCSSTNKGTCTCPAATIRTGKEQLPVVTIVAKPNKCTALKESCTLVGAMMVSGKSTKGSKANPDATSNKNLLNIPSRYCRTFSDPQFKPSGNAVQGSRRVLLGRKGSTAPPKPKAESPVDSGNFICSDEKFDVEAAAKAFCEEQDVFVSFPKGEGTYKTSTINIAPISGAGIGCSGITKSAGKGEVVLKCADEQVEEGRDLDELGEGWGSRRRKKKSQETPKTEPKCGTCHGPCEAWYKTVKYLSQVTCCKRAENADAAKLQKQLNNVLNQLSSVKGSTEIFTIQSKTADQKSADMCAALRAEIDPVLREAVADTRFEMTYPDCPSDPASSCATG